MIVAEGKCTYGGCNEAATHVAAKWSDGFPRRRVVAAYCERHAEMIREIECPEYKEECPNCGCKFGVG